MNKKYFYFIYYKSSIVRIKYLVARRSLLAKIKPTEEKILGGLCVIAFRQFCTKVQNKQPPAMRVRVECYPKNRTK